MIKTKRIIAIAILCMVSLVATTCVSLASSVTFKGGAEGFVFEPGSEESPTDLFTEFKNVMPGDVLHQTINVKNDQAKKIKIFLRANPTKDAEMLNDMHLNVMNGSTELFDAPAGETGELTEWNCLGTFMKGANIDLDVTLTVPEELGNDFGSQTGVVNWEFAVEEVPEDKPKTGDTTQLLLIVGIAGACLAIVAIAAARRKKNA